MINASGPLSSKNISSLNVGTGTKVLVAIAGVVILGLATVFICRRLFFTASKHSPTDDSPQKPSQDDKPKDDKITQAEREQLDQEGKKLLAKKAFLEQKPKMLANLILTHCDRLHFLIDKDGKYSLTHGKYDVSGKNLLESAHLLPSSMRRPFYRAFFQIEKDFTNANQEEDVKRKLIALNHSVSEFDLNQQIPNLKSKEIDLFAQQSRTWDYNCGIAFFYRQPKILGSLILKHCDRLHFLVDKEEKYQKWQIFSFQRAHSENLSAQSILKPFPEAISRIEDDFTNANQEEDVKRKLIDLNNSVPEFNPKQEKPILLGQMILESCPDFQSLLDSSNCYVPGAARFLAPRNICAIRQQIDDLYEQYVRLDQTEDIKKSLISIYENFKNSTT